MKKSILFFLVVFYILIYGGQIKAQQVYSCDYKHEAEVKVYVTNYKYEAELVVYKCKYKYDAEGNKGLWFFVEHKYNADKKIYFVDSKYEADRYWKQPQLFLY